MTSYDSLDYSQTKYDLFALSVSVMLPLQKKLFSRFFK